MQIAPGSSPLSLAVLKTLGSQLTAGGSGVTAKAASAALGSATPARNEPPGPPEPGQVIPRGSFVDLKV